MTLAYLVRDATGHAFFVALVTYALACLPPGPGIPLAMIVVVGYALLRGMNRTEIALSEERRTREMEKERYFAFYLILLFVMSGGAVVTVVHYRRQLAPALYPEDLRHREQQELLQAVILRLDDVVTVEKTGQEERGKEREAWQEARRLLEQRGALMVQVRALEEQLQALVERMETYQTNEKEARLATERERERQEKLLTILERRIRDLETAGKGETE